ncbi:MAG: hypothetical protein ACLGHY_03710 [Gammaproteobacteria bacterium]
MTDTPRPDRTPSDIDLDEISRLIDALERDLARARVDSSRIDSLRAEVEQLRTMLGAEEPATEDLQRELSGLRDLMHRLGDELINDAFEGGQYIAQLGRILGL